VCILVILYEWINKFFPAGGLTFFACPKKVSKEKAPEISNFGVFFSREADPN